MAGQVRRHLLVFYKVTLDRWWNRILLIGILLLLFSACLNFLPGRLPQFHIPWIAGWKRQMITGAGVFAVILAIFLVTIRKQAYVQVFMDHLRLVTPFLRLNISYHRITRTMPVEIRRIFLGNKTFQRYHDLLRPLAGRTAVVVEMKALPVSRKTLRLFLSPLFLPDRSSSLVLLVPDWVAFSTELDSRRSTWQESLRKTYHR